MTNDRADPLGEDFDKNLEKLAEKSELPKVDLPDFESTMDEKLRDIESRAGAAKARQENAYERESKVMESNRESYRGLGLGLSIAYAILGMPLAGFGIGWLIDRQAGGQMWQGLLCVAGACAGIWFAVRTTNLKQK